MLTPTHTICLKSDAFYALIDTVVEHIDSKFNLSKESPRWITGDETMKLLNIGRVTLQKMRDEGRIAFHSVTGRISCMTEIQSWNSLNLTPKKSSNGRARKDIHHRV